MYNQEIQKLKRQRNIQSYQIPYTSQNYYHIPSHQHDYPSSKFLSTQNHELYHKQKDYYPEFEQFSRMSGNIHHHSTYPDLLQDKNRKLQEQLERMRQKQFVSQQKIKKLQKKTQIQEQLLVECQKQIQKIKRNYEAFVVEIDSLKKEKEKNLSLSSNIIAEDQAQNEQSEQSDKSFSKQQATFGQQTDQNTEKYYKTFYDYLAQKIMKEQKQILMTCSKISDHHENHQHSDSHHLKKLNHTKHSSKKNDHTENILIMDKNKKSHKQSHRLLKPFS